MADVQQPAALGQPLRHIETGIIDGDFNSERLALERHLEVHLVGTGMFLGVVYRFGAGEQDIVTHTS